MPRQQRQEEGPGHRSLSPQKGGNGNEMQQSAISAQADQKFYQATPKASKVTQLQWVKFVLLVCVSSYTQRYSTLHYLPDRAKNVNETVVV